MTNETLTMEELDKISGGDFWEAFQDDGLLWKYGIQNYKPKTNAPLKEFFKSLEKTWSKIGITSKISETEPNEYYIAQSDGSKIQITFQEAHEYVKSNFKKVRGL